MDLRKYIKKRVNTEKVLKHEYVYYSHASGEGSSPCLVITIGREDKNGYDLMIILDSSGRILEVSRLKESGGVGYLIKRFPDLVEEKANDILAEIIVLTPNDKSDLSMLRDEYAEWEKNKNNH